jgi:predicted nucleic acid-binding protein
MRLSLNPQIVPAALTAPAALDLLRQLTAHPNHQFIAEMPALTSQSFDPLVARIQGYRQMSDATLLMLAKSHGLKLITFDRAIQALTPWPESLEILAA